MSYSPVTTEDREFENAELRWDFCTDFIEPNLAAAAGDDESARDLLPNHEFLIRSPAQGIAIEKCRKTAHSFGVALKAYSRMATEPKSTTIIGSYDEDEAKEKRNFLDWIDDSLEATAEGRAVRRDIGMSDGQQMVRAKNKARIRIIAHKPPTGAGAAIELDEFTVDPKGRHTPSEILTAALGATTHKGSVSIGGTPRGSDTILNQIVNGGLEAKAETDELIARLSKRTWAVRRYAWWTSPALVKFPIWIHQIEDRETRKQAQREHLQLVAVAAPTMPTEDRVEKFGNDRLQAQFVLYVTTPTLGLDIFQREFELMTLDDKESYYSYELLSSCYPLNHPAHEFARDYYFIPVSVDGKLYGVYGDALRDAKDAVDAVADELRNRRWGGNWGMTIDIARDRDLDEIWIGHAPATDHQMLLPRLNISMTDMPFDGKEEIIDYIMRRLPITRGLVDATRGSMGVQLGERMYQRYGQAAMPFVFSTENKQIMASGFRMRLQSRKIIVPPKTAKYSKLEVQLLKLKKIESGRMILFDIERTEKEGHGDCAWSLLMLSHVFIAPEVYVPRIGAVMEQNHPSLAALTARFVGRA